MSKYIENKQTKENSTYPQYKNIMVHISSNAFKIYNCPFWKKTLINMLICLENKANYIFQNPKLDLFLVSDKEIAAYNKKYMNCVGATNILSFPNTSHEEVKDLYTKHVHNNTKNTNIYHKNDIVFSPLQNPFKQYTNTHTNSVANSVANSVVADKSKVCRTNLGILALSINTLERETQLFGQKIHEHIVRLLAHGLVHLLGFDHGNDMQELTDLLEDNYIIQKNTIQNNLETFIPFWSYYHG